MYQDPDELCGIEAFQRDWIDGLIHNLKARLSLQALYLFGSRAADEHLTWSDYDVCVISDDFVGLRPWERMELVLSCWRGHRALEPVCFTTTEFNQGTSSLVEEVRGKGILLYP